MSFWPDFISLKAICKPELKANVKYGMKKGKKSE